MKRLNCRHPLVYKGIDSLILRDAQAQFRNNIVLNLKCNLLCERSSKPHSKFLRIDI